MSACKALSSKKGTPGNTSLASGPFHLLDIFARLAIALAFGVAAPAHAQISPGPLARVHQDLNGGTNCVKCHELSPSAPSFRCLECHQEIAAELRQNEGLHATFPRSSSAGSACVKCHSDHNGENFQMIHWTPTASGFAHTATGFALDGKHVGISCRACHSAQRIPAAAKALLRGKDLNHTWLGLTPTCGNCHEDKHQGRFGTDCARCHSTMDWKAASQNLDAKNFDHSTTRYPLIGAHRSVSCMNCHRPGPDSQPQYTGLHFNSCADCHRDPHKGEFKQTCESCHSTSNWRDSPFVAKFDHAKTGFPLAGKHLALQCLSCHEGADFKSPVPHAACADCHEPDPHAGQFASRPDRGKCESCHTVNGWTPSTFSTADHARTGFPLIFPHAAVKCAQCHTPAGTGTKFKIRFAQCVECHEDEHQGQFSGPPWLNGCGKCHTGATFERSNYNLKSHSGSNFPLTGAHAAVECSACHKPTPGAKLVLFHFSQVSCATCHQDVHQGQFARRMAVRNAQGKLLGCEACHSTREWKDLIGFNHAQTSFPLLGSHQAVSCVDCHKPPEGDLTLAHVNFASAPAKCSDCHNNPHADQFEKQALDCASCHNTNQWRPSLFDHQRTQFSLRGGHEHVPCAVCHTLNKQVNGRTVLFYKPVPLACEACHRSTVPASSDHARM
ncbi:MAG TPA: cytochrome c3 family protein [Terracidiphilus sp.]